MRDQVFISYSHKDREWLEKFQVVLKPLIRRGVVTIWDDTRIQTGQKWRDEIQQALDSAKVAVLLVSPDFLASDFISESELPPLLEAAGRDGLTIVWVPVRDCLFGETEIKDYQAAWNPDRPLASLSAAEADKALVDISKKIKAATVPPKETPPPSKQARPARNTPAPAPTPILENPEPVPANPPTPFPPSANLNDFLPGRWQVQIQTGYPGAVGQMQLEILPTGLFRGNLMTPMGQTMVEGQWQSNPLLQQIGLQGRQSNGYQVIPYAVMIQLTYLDHQQLVGVTSAGEQVVWQRLGAAGVPPPLPPRCG